MKVSAIMPTRARSVMAANALACFDAQSWADREIVILDDSTAPSFPQGIDRENVQYFRIAGLEIGARRNILCGRANGEIICHWDDDDYSAPGRIADQVQRLISSGKSVTGYSSMEFRSDSERWQYRGGPECCLGTSLCYRRDWWKNHAFPVQQIGEDGEFVRVAYGAAQLVVADARGLMTASIHAGNTSPRQLTGSNWTRL